MNAIRNSTLGGSSTSRVGVLISAFAFGLTTLAIGAAIVKTPSIVMPLLVLITAGIWLGLRGNSAWWDILGLTTLGLYVLDYGFSNVHAPGIPIPIVDIAGVALLGRAVSRPGFRWPRSAPFVFGAAYVSIVSLRLLVDVPHFGVLAMRDATLAIEVSFLFIGYWVIHEYGLQPFVKLLTYVFVVGVLYWLLYPFRDTIQAASPVVGIQRPVPLVGTFVNGVAIYGGFFFFALVRPFGSRSYWLAALTLPLMILLQSRGLYLAVPSAILLIAALARARTGARARRGLATTLAIGAIALAAFFPFAPEGRVGKVSPSFVLAQIETLAGKQGPGSSVDQRKEWVRRTLQKVSDTPEGWLVGVGLGPDLAFGFKNEFGVSVRKPHNDYLEAYARLGVFGLAALVGVIGFGFARIVRGARSAEGLEGRFLWFALAQTFVLAVIAATQPLLAFPYGTIPLFVVLGAGIAVAEGTTSPRRGLLSVPHAPQPMVAARDR